MRFNLNINDEWKLNWHVWFAWLPVEIGSTGNFVWLEKVQRKGKKYPCLYYYEGQKPIDTRPNGMVWEYEYKLLEKL